MNLLPTNLAALTEVADKKGVGGRFTLSGVRLEVNPKDNTFTAEATDTKVLLRVSGPCGNLDDYPEHPGMKDAPNGSTTALIPTETWTKVFAGAEKLTRRKMPSLQAVAVKIGKQLATFGSTNLDTFPVDQTKLMEGRFPPTQEIITQTTKKLFHSFWVDPMQISRALKALATVGCDADSQAVEIMIPEDVTKPFLIQAQRSNGIKSELLVMPLGEKSTIKLKKGKGEEPSNAETETSAELEQLKAHHEEQVKTLKGDLDIARHEIEEHFAEADRLRQEIANLREILEARDTRISELVDEKYTPTPHGSVGTNGTGVQVATVRPVLSRRERLQRIGA
jgi:hypothetical protein